MPAKMKVYYLHNIDGRRCGMIAACNKPDVRKVIRIPPSEIAEAGHDPDAQTMALAEPGVLFVSIIGARNPSWVRW